MSIESVGSRDAAKQKCTGQDSPSQESMSQPKTSIVQELRKPSLEEVGTLNLEF